MSARDKKIVIVLLGAIVLALAFFFGHRPLKEKRDILNAENASLRDMYADLSMKAADADMYSKEIKQMNSKMEEIFVHYPSSLLTENEIMDAVSFETETKSIISSLSISEPVAVEIGASESGEVQYAEDGTPIENSAQATVPYELYNVATNITFEAGYEGMKQLIDIIATDSKKKSVGTLSAVFDNEQGKISGNMAYNTYFVNGLDKPYVEPTVPAIKHGTKNIFGTVDTVAE